jgi:hypothetical protein
MSTKAVVAAAGASVDARTCAKLVVERVVDARGESSDIVAFRRTLDAVVGTDDATVMSMCELLHACALRRQPQHARACLVWLIARETAADPDKLPARMAAHIAPAMEASLRGGTTTSDDDDDAADADAIDMWSLWCDLRDHVGVAWTLTAVQLRTLFATQPFACFDRVKARTHADVLREALYKAEEPARVRDIWYRLAAELPSLANLMREADGEFARLHSDHDARARLVLQHVFPRRFQAAYATWSALLTTMPLIVSAWLVGDAAMSYAEVVVDDARETVPASNISTSDDDTSDDDDAAADCDCDKGDGDYMSDTDDVGGDTLEFAPMQDVAHDASRSRLSRRRHPPPPPREVVYYRGDKVREVRVRYIFTQCRDLDLVSHDFAMLHAMCLTPRAPCHNLVYESALYTKSATAHVRRRDNTAAPRIQLMHVSHLRKLAPWCKADARLTFPVPTTTTHAYLFEVPVFENEYRAESVVACKNDAWYIRDASAEATRVSTAERESKFLLRMARAVKAAEATPFRIAEWLEHAVRTRSCVNIEWCCKYAATHGGIKVGEWARRLLLEAVYADRGRASLYAFHAILVTAYGTAYDVATWNACMAELLRDIASLVSTATRWRIEQTVIGMCRLIDSGVDSLVAATASLTMTRGGGGGGVITVPAIESSAMTLSLLPCMWRYQFEAFMRAGNVRDALSLLAARVAARGTDFGDVLTSDVRQKLCSLVYEFDAPTTMTYAFRQPMSESARAWIARLGNGGDGTQVLAPPASMRDIALVATASAANETHESWRWVLPERDVAEPHASCVTRSQSWTRRAHRLRARATQAPHDLERVLNDEAAFERAYVECVDTPSTRSDGGGFMNTVNPTHFAAHPVSRATPNNPTPVVGAPGGLIASFMRMLGGDKRDPGDSGVPVKNVSDAGAMPSVRRA